MSRQRRNMMSWARIGWGKRRTDKERCGEERAECVERDRYMVRGVEGTQLGVGRYDGREGGFIARHFSCVVEGHGGRERK